MHGTRGWLIIRSGVLVLLVAAVCGCSRAAGTEPSSSRALLLALSTSGGFAGDESTLTIRHDGQVQRTKDGRPAGDARLSTQQLEVMRQAISTAKLADLNRSYGGKGGADNLHLKLETPGSTVVVNGLPIPPSLETLLKVVQQVVSSVGLSS